MDADTRFLILSLVLLAATYAVGVAAIVSVSKRSDPSLPPLPPLTAGELGGSWIVIGSGLTAAAFVHAVPTFIRNAVRLRESSETVGGRAQTQPMAVSLPSTITPPREFGAWAFKPFTHVGVRRLLHALNMSVVPVELRTPYTFIWDNGKRREFGELPEVTSKTLTFADVATADPALWFGHTGAWVQSCPKAAAHLLYRLDMPVYGNVVTGFGWQAVTLQCIGRTPVRYNSALDAIALKENGVSLSYASGESEQAAGCVLTMSPADIVQVKGLPDAFVTKVQRAFSPVSIGIIYAVWASADAWWQALGFYAGGVATTLPIGRVFITSDNELRMQLSGDDHVAYWTQKFVVEGVAAAQADIGSQLSQVFGVTVPPPASAVYKPWPRGVMLWNAGEETSEITRPFGVQAPVFWASSDISDHPAWIGGAVQMGTDTATAVKTYIMQSKRKL